MQIDEELERVVAIGMIPDEAERSRFLDHLRDHLTGYGEGDGATRSPWAHVDLDVDIRDEGLDWPSTALTMIGRQRLQNFRELIENAIVQSVPGDILEAGVWRGGASVMARAVLATHGVRDRKVWVCDSFQGLPEPDVDRFPADAGGNFHTYPELAVSLQAVRASFERFGLLDDQVMFVEGWFRDTMPVVPVESIAVLRLDGDMYESTIDPLIHLYDRVTPGGWIIIDDYRLLACCEAAVTDFCQDRGIEPELIPIDRVGVYWQKATDRAS